MLSVLAATLALVAPASSWAASWLAPGDLSSPQSSLNCGLFGSQPGAGGVDVAVDSQGNAVAAWTRRDNANNQIVQASIRPAGGSFGPAQDVGALAASADCYFLGILGPLADVAIADDGTAVVVWPGSSNGNTTIQAATRPPGGSFGAAQNLSEDSTAADADPRVAMSRSGHAVAVWSRMSGGNTLVQASSKSPGQPFGLPTTLSAVGQDAESARVAVNETGAAAVTWARSDGANMIAQARVRPAGGSFATVQNLSAVGADATAPDIAIDSQGRATALWVRTTGADERVESRALTAAGAFASGVDPVSDAGRDGSFPQLALDPSNTAVAAWIDCPTAASDCVVATTSRPSGASFGAVQPVSAPGDNNSLPKVVMDSSGNAVIAWSQFSTQLKIQTIRRSGGGVFSGVETISPPEGSAVAPSLAVDGAGSTIAGWSFLRPSPDNRQVVQVAIFDGGAPELRNLSVAGNGRALQALAFSVSPFDRYSPVAVTWNFGDGVTAVGNATQHTYAGPGTFTTTVTASDAAGNTNSASATIQVGPADRDGDGFPEGQDCNDNDADIRPGAIEVRGNDVDENCDGRKAPFRTIDAGLRYSFDRFPRFLRLTTLKVRSFPRNSRIKATCKVKKSKAKTRKAKKRKCPGRARKAFTKKRARGTVNLRKRFVGVKLRPGTKITVTVTKARHIGDAKILKIRKGKNPKLVDRCIRPGGRKVRKRC